MKTRKLIAITAFCMIMLSTAEAFAQTRIRFARGRTSATVSGTIGNIGERDFVLRALGGQYLSARVTSSNGCIWFATTEYSQAYYTDPGDNWLKLMNRCRNRASYTMTVSIR